VNYRGGKSVESAENVDGGREIPAADQRIEFRTEKQSAAPAEAAGRVGSTWLGRILSTPVAVRWLLGAALLACVAGLDASTGNEISFSIFYLLPVSFAGALISRRAGVIFSVLSAVLWGYIDVAIGRAFSAAWIPYWNSAVRLAFFLLVNELIQRLLQAHVKQRALAREDPITGIANARVFAEHAQWAIALSRRSGRPFTLAYIDLDHFKQVNDKFGHSEGDRLLRTIALIMEHGARSSDFVARLGGDEFGILMPDTDAEQARALLERIAASVADRAGAHWGVGATFGAVTFTRPPESVDRALQEADALMYRGKANGRNLILQTSWPRDDIAS
jgi:diguanylate cyclase (GGDEF)-like protein